jgi:plastocyanin
MIKLLSIIGLAIFIFLAGFYLVTKPKSQVAIQTVPSGQEVFMNPDEVRPGDMVIKITDSGFVPAEAKVKTRQRVVWINETKNFAWPAVNPHPTHTDYAGFDSQLPLKTNQAWSFIFDDAGIWHYHDHLKPSNKAHIIVTN